MAVKFQLTGTLEELHTDKEYDELRRRTNDREVTIAIEVQS